MTLDGDTLIQAIIQAFDHPQFLEKLKESQNEVKSDIKSLEAIVREKNDALVTMQQELSKYKAENKLLSTKLEQVENDLDNMEQYARRNSIRISGITERDDENVYSDVIGLFKKELSVEMHPNLIDRAHRLGAKGKGKDRNIIVKFTSYQARQKVFEARKKLRTHNEKSSKAIYINEDLTQKRAKLLYQARELKKEGKIKDCWTHDGRIIVKNNVSKIETVLGGKDLERYRRSQPHSPSPSTKSKSMDMSSQEAAASTTPSPTPSPKNANIQAESGSWADEIVLEESNGTKILSDGSICFLSKEAPLSNWYKAPITIDNVTYNCNEQYYFATKAKAAKDDTAHKKIMKANDPHEQQRIGSKLQVDPILFNEEEVMRKAIDTKFTQHDNLKRYLLSTGENMLYEATTNPYWGIGVSLKSRDLTKMEKWANNKLGLNRLGQLLMEHRKKLSDNDEDDLYD